MAEARAHVLNTVRGGVAPGSSISVKLTAETLRMSPTPVREALERLVGEGVLICTADRQGFAVPRLTVRDVAGLHRLHGALLRGLTEPPVIVSDDPWAPDALHPSETMNGLVGSLCRNPSTAMIAAAVKSAELRLTAYRRVEPGVMPDWVGGLVRLREGLAKDSTSALRAISSFTEARVRLADAIVAAVEDLHGSHAADSFRI